MPRRKKKITVNKSGDTKKTTYKKTKKGFKKREVTKKKDGTKMVRRVKSTGTVGGMKVKTRRTGKK